MSAPKIAIAGYLIVIDFYLLFVISINIYHYFDTYVTIISNYAFGQGNYGDIGPLPCFLPLGVK